MPYKELATELPVEPEMSILTSINAISFNQTNYHNPIIPFINYRSTLGIALASCAFKSGFVLAFLIAFAARVRSNQTARADDDMPVKPRHD